MIRVRERNNAWPSFVDLFANLVIVMIFLLIVFVFLWTTTNVFNRGTEKVEIAKLRKINAEHTQTIESLKESEETAKALLLTARDELITLDMTRAELETEVNALVDENGGLMSEREQMQNDIGGEREKMAREQADLVASYEKKLADLQNERAGLTATIGTLNAQIGAASVERES
ncbi:MAG: hypothetical protein LBL46_03755, partial [Rickettsiales bacterium]|nr:hypothetical protein [Rickettsiales bacterium]